MYPFSLFRILQRLSSEKIGWPTQTNLSLVVRKPVFGVSDHVRHKPGCTTMEDTCSLRLEISDLGSGGIVLSL